MCQEPAEGLEGTPRETGRLYGDPGCEQYLIRVVGGGLGALHTVGGHDCPQVITLHQELVLLLSTLLVDVDDSSGHLWDTLHHHLDSETQKVWDPVVPMVPIKLAASETAAAVRTGNAKPWVCHSDHPCFSMVASVAYQT